MECTHKGLALLLMACLLLAGCGPSYTYRYSPPPSADGMNCISSCSTERNHCRQMAKLQDSSDRALHRAEMNAYQQCLSGKSKKEARRSCFYPSHHFGTDSSFSCKADYDTCYMTCGGTVQRILDSH